MVWSEGNMSLKNPVTPPGIDPGTVGLVAQRLKHYATPGPRKRVRYETQPHLPFLHCTEILINRLCHCSDVKNPKLWPQSRKRYVPSC